MRHRSILVAGVAVSLAALSLSACKSSSSSGGSGGSGTSGSASPGKTLIISTDLPLQGTNKDTEDSTNNLIQLYLDSVGSKAGKYTIKLKIYDDSTTAKGGWDAATCSANANAHVTNTDEIAVMGTYNSGCAKLEVPILNAAPMLMVSNANTNPGLTKTWDPGEPDKYYPTGKRNYARVVPTDDVQGPVGADFAFNDLKVKSCYVVNDNSTYGLGVATAFVAGAKKNGLTILGNESWDSKQPNYQALMTKIKATNPGCLYLAGTYDQNGGQLIKDKFNVLGDNTAVKLVAPDGFEGFTDAQKQPEAQGMYMTFPGLDSGQLISKGGTGGKLLTAYKTKYGTAPVGSYPLYGVAAVQVMLAAIAKSDGTRQSVIDQIFSGSGVSIPADTSVLGKELTIDTKSGDVNAKDYSILLMKGNAETFLKSASGS